MVEFDSRKVRCIRVDHIKAKEEVVPHVQQ